MISDISKEELKINIHHVGGIGGYGPTAILSRLGHVRWIVYDAEAKALGLSNKILGNDFLFKNMCIGKRNYLGRFNVMAAKSASSMFKGAKEAADYTVINSNGTAQIWGVHTKITKTYKTRVYSLDWLRDKNKVPQIDVISMDVQGAELDILNGASRALATTVVGVICETDFSRLYSRQPLFGNIQIRLDQDNFRLFQIYNLQTFNTKSYPKELSGKGFLAVGESLFLKDRQLNQNMTRAEIIQCLKLAVCAVAFDQLEFALHIVDFLVKNTLISLETLVKKTNVSYIKMLRDLYKAKVDIELKSPEVIYQSTNVTDVSFKNQNGDSEDYFEKIQNVFFKINLFLAFWSINIIRRILKNLGQKRTVYLSQISKIYDQYGFEDLARLNDSRLFWFRLFLHPSPVDRLLKPITKENKNLQLLLFARNYFKGKY